MSTTVVSAFYPLSKSKHGVVKYLEWIKNFCVIPCSLVIFTDTDSSAHIREARGSLPLHIIERPFNSYEMTSPSRMEFWQRHHLIDPEKNIHTPELYAVWALKQECVREAIHMNPFNSSWFVWCDIGIQRESALQKFYETFPSKTSELCPAGRICFLEVERIPDSYVADWASSAPMKYPVPWTTVGGGCIAGDVAAWTDFSRAYLNMLDLFDKKGWFAGKDQVLYFTALMMRTTEKPYRLFYAKKFAEVSGIHWMSFPAILGGTVPAEIDMRFEDTRPECFVHLLGGLGNQLFQIAAGIAHSMRTKRRLVVSATTEGGRPIYWDSFLQSCARYVGPKKTRATWNEPYFHYHEVSSSADGLFGYFQSSRYFSDIAPIIKRLFTPSDKIQKSVHEKYSHLLTEELINNGVVVHVRRGDYIQPDKVAYHVVTTPTYFEKACSLMKERNPASRFLVFSEDLEWCRAQPYFTDAIFVDEADECIALHLMSHYRQYIISNSSFSWWSVWLNKPAEVVYAPDRWFGPRGHQDIQDIYEPSWIRIPCT
jgi:hypothetical protein